MQLLNIIYNITNKTKLINFSSKNKVIAALTRNSFVQATPDEKVTHERFLLKSAPCSCCSLNLVNFSTFYSIINKREMQTTSVGLALDD